MHAASPAVAGATAGSLCLDRPVRKGPVVTERRFSDEEVALILRRATEAAGPAGRGAGDGLTLAELRAIGAEAGIDPEAITRAARQVVARPPEERNLLLGAPVTRQLEEVIPGRVDPDGLADAVLAIRRVMGRQGVVTTELDGVHWKARDTMGGRYVSIRPVGGRTMVRALGNYRDGAFVHFMAGGTMTGMGALVVLKTTGLLAALGLGVAPILAAAAYLPARWLWRRRARREQAHLEATLQEVVRTLEARAADATPGGTPPPVA